MPTDSFIVKKIVYNYLGTYLNYHILMIRVLSERNNLNLW